MTQNEYLSAMLNLFGIDSLIANHGLLFLDVPSHREWKPTGACYYYWCGGNQPVWWSYNLNLFLSHQKVHGGIIWDADKNKIK